MFSFVHWALSITKDIRRRQTPELDYRKEKGCLYETQMQLLKLQTSSVGPTLMQLGCDRMLLTWIRASYKIDEIYNDYYHPFKGPKV